MKAGDADASAAEAVQSSSPETATKCCSAETTNPAAETANRATTKASTPKPTATEAATAEATNVSTTEPATVSTGEPATVSPTKPATTVTTTPAAAMSTPAAAAMSTPTAATSTRGSINRGKSDCSTNRGGDGNSDDCFSKHGKSPRWNDLPDRANLVTPNE